MTEKKSIKVFSFILLTILATICVISMTACGGKDEGVTRIYFDDSNDYYGSTVNYSGNMSDSDSVTLFNAIDALCKYNGCFTIQNTEVEGDEDSTTESGKTSSSRDYDRKVTTFAFENTSGYLVKEYTNDYYSNYSGTSRGTSTNNKYWIPGEENGMTLYCYDSSSKTKTMTDTSKDDDEYIDACNIANTSNLSYIFDKGMEWSTIIGLEDAFIGYGEDIMEEVEATWKSNGYKINSIGFSAVKGTCGNMNVYRVSFDVDAYQVITYTFSYGSYSSSYTVEFDQLYSHGFEFYVNAAGRLTKYHEFRDSWVTSEVLDIYSSSRSYYYDNYVIAYDFDENLMLSESDMSDYS